MEPNPDANSSFNEENANQERDLPDYSPVRELEITSETHQENATDIEISDANLSSDSSDSSDSEEDEAVSDKLSQNSIILFKSDESFSTSNSSVIQQAECSNDNFTTTNIFIDDSWSSEEDLMEEELLREDYDDDIGSGSGSESESNANKD